MTFLVSQERQFLIRVIETVRLTWHLTKNHQQNI